MEDRSSKRTWDEKITRLCRRLNSKREYYTTSSCSGRIVLIKSSDRKKSNLFLFVSHDAVTLKSIRSELKKAVREDFVYFKQEPCVLAVACYSLAGAQILLDKAKFAGWKNSGIIASRGRIICELRSTEKIELPIIKNKKILVSDAYLKILVEEANRKLERTWGKILKLEKLI